MTGACIMYVPEDAALYPLPELHAARATTTVVFSVATRVTSTHMHAPNLHVRAEKRQATGLAELTPQVWKTQMYVMLVAIVQFVRGGHFLSRRNHMAGSWVLLDLDRKSRWINDKSNLPTLGGDHCCPGPTWWRMVQQFWKPNFGRSIFSSLSLGWPTLKIRGSICWHVCGTDVPTPLTHECIGREAVWSNV